LFYDAKRADRHDEANGTFSKISKVPISLKMSEADGNMSKGQCE
jgi:hypothetical protein